MDKFYYIYNPHQANFYFLNGVPIIEIGKGAKGDTYIKFPKNQKSEEVFKRWIEKCKLINE